MLHSDSSKISALTYIFPPLSTQISCEAFRETFAEALELIFTRKEEVIVAIAPCAGSQSFPPPSVYLSKLTLNLKSLTLEAFAELVFAAVFNCFDTA